MEQFGAVMGRNLKIYFRDRGAVFFSLLSMIIVICLMMFFLGDMNIENTTELLGQFPGRDAPADEKNAELLIFTWTCAGIVAINAVTVTLAVYSAMIKDRASGRLNAIYTAPVGRLKIAAGYLAAAWTASVLVCTATFFITEMYGCVKGMEPFSFLTHIQLIGMILLNSFTYAALMYLVAMLARTEGAWSGLGTVVGTVVGFLGGIYIPIGALSDLIGNLMKCTPVIYGTSMFRSVMMKGIIDETFSSISEDVVKEYERVMGIGIRVFDREMSIEDEAVILLLCGIIFFVIGMGFLKYGRKADR